MLFLHSQMLCIQEATVLEGTPVKLSLDPFFLFSPAGLDALAEARHTRTLAFHVGRDFLPLSEEYIHKL